MSAIIETKNASLSTMAVTIQALHVNSRQMTLAVFRQLPIIETYYEDGSLVELEHWGLVRYSIKNQGYVWLVCSKDGILYRASIDVDYAFFNIDRAKENLADKQSVLSAYETWEPWAEDHEERLGYVPYHLYAKRAAFKFGQLSARQADVAEAADLLAVRERAVESRRRLLELPQLFIAV